MTLEQECSVEGCDDPAKVKGWCRIHYTRWYRHGDPTTVLPKKGRPRSRLGLPHLFLDPPSYTNYGRGCRCDQCSDEMCDYKAAGKARIKTANEEMRAHVAQIRERMGMPAWTPPGR